MRRPLKRPPTLPTQSKKLYVERSIMRSFKPYSSHIEVNLYNLLASVLVGQLVEELGSGKPKLICWKSSLWF